MGYSEKYRWLRIQHKFKPWLNDEEIEMVRTIRDYMQERVKPRVWELEGAHHDRDWDSACDFVAEIGSDLTKLGWQQMGIPEEYGGITVSLACRLAMGEEIARVDLPLSSQIGKVAWMCGPIFQSKNEVLKKMMAEKVCGDDFWLGCVCMTEPQGGVSAEDITLHGRTLDVVAEMDRSDRYVLNGEKVFPGPSGPAEIWHRENLKGHLGYIVLAATEPDKDKRGWDTIGLFYVPPDAKGLSFSNPYELMGCTMDRNCHIYLDDVKIPKEYRIAGPGFDAALYYTLVAASRLGIAARLTGAAAGLFEKALDQASVREIEGRPLREYSLWADMLGQMAERVFASRAAYFYATSAILNPQVYGNIWDQDGPNGIAAGMKAIAGRTFRYVADRTMEIFCGQGYCCEFGVEKMVRDGQMAILGPGGHQRENLDMSLLFYSRTWSDLAPEFERWKPQAQ